MRHLRTAVLTAAVLALLPATASAKTVFLDTYERRDDGFIGPVQSQRLKADLPYIASIKGTVSYQDRRVWGAACGTPLRRPQFPSPRRRNGRVGADAAWVFANFGEFCRTGTGLGFAVFLKVATRGTYADAQLLDGPPTGPRSDHTYRFALRGGGRRAKFRIPESYVRDNYGRFRITVRRARANECTGARAAVFGYASNEECVAAVGGVRPAPAPTPVPAPTPTA